MCGEKVDWFEKLADFHRIASYLDNIDLLVNVSQSLLKGSGFLPLSLSPHKLLIARHACRAQAAHQAAPPDNCPVWAANMKRFLRTAGWWLSLKRPGCCC